MKNILKSKKGSFIIIGVIIIPLLIFIIFYIIFTQMNSTMSYKRIQSSVDNALYYATAEYGNIKFDKNGDGYCDFDVTTLNGANEDSMASQEVTSDTTPNPTAKDKFLWNFKNYLKCCDGYNELWTFTLSIKTNAEYQFNSNKNENNEYISAEVIVVLPDQSNKDAVCWGTAGSGEEWTYWYKENSAHWQSCVSRYYDWYSFHYNDWYNGKASAPSGLLMMKVEVSASCY